MWMPPQTTRPPLRIFFKAIGTRAPTGAKTIAASSGSGGAVSESPAQCAPQVVITPACGLPGASPKQARDALRWCREAARALPELIEEGAG